MKHWRRTSSSGGGVSPPPPPPPPTVLSVVADGGGVFYLVTFSAPVTWNGSGAGTMEFNGHPGAWTQQDSPTTIENTPTIGGAVAGDAWDWAGPDADLSPTPDETQSGTTS